MYKICNVYIYLSTWSESGIVMLAPNYFHVEYMEYLYTLSENWYRNVETKCFFICKIFNNYQYTVYSQYVETKCYVSTLTNNYCIFMCAFLFIHMLCKKQRHVETESFSFVLKSSVFSYNQHVCNSILVIMLLFSYFM